MGDSSTADKLSSEGVRGRVSTAAVAISVTAHVIVLIALAMLPSSVPRDTHSYVLAYLIEADLPGSPSRIGKGPGVRPAEVRSAARKKPAAKSVPRSRVKIGDVRTSEGEKEPAEMSAPLQADASQKDKDSASRLSSAREREGSRDELERMTKAEGLSSGIGRGGGGGGTGEGAYSGGAHARYGESPAPEYPELARRGGWQGTVVLRVEVSADGGVERVEVAKSSGYGALDRAAAEKVRLRWRFEPAQRDGVKIASWVLVPIRFALEESRAGE